MQSTIWYWDGWYQQGFDQFFVLYQTLSLNLLSLPHSLPLAICLSHSLVLLWSYSLILSLLLSTCFVSFHVLSFVCLSLSSRLDMPSAEGACLFATSIDASLHSEEDLGQAEIVWLLRLWCSEDNDVALSSTVRRSLTGNAATQSQWLALDLGAEWLVEAWFSEPVFAAAAAAEADLFLSRSFPHLPHCAA